MKRKIAEDLKTASARGWWWGKDAKSFSFSRTALALVLRARFACVIVDFRKEKEKRLCTG